MWSWTSCRCRASFPAQPRTEFLRPRSIGSSEFARLASVDVGERRGAPLTTPLRTAAALFAIEIALAEQWRAWGVSPDVVVGHSVGDFAAACVAGVMSVEDGAHLVVARGRLMAERMAPGAMAAIFAPVSDVRAAIARAGEIVTIAADNGPANVVVAGAVEALRAVCDDLAARGVSIRPLEVTRAFHSPMVDPVLQLFAEEVARTSLHRPEIEIVASSTGTSAEHELTTVEHWVSHAREPVRFGEAIVNATSTGGRVVVEIGPGAALLGIGRRCVTEPAVWLASLKPKSDERVTLLTALGEAWAQGVPVAWNAVHDGSRRRASLPAYPFERRRFWFAGRSATENARSMPSAPARVAADSPSLRTGPSSPSDEDALRTPPSRIPREVHAIVAGVVHLAPEDLLSRHRLAEDLGLDSLMTTELAAKLKKAFRLEELPLGLLLGGDGHGDLVEFAVLANVGDEDESPPTSGDRGIGPAADLSAALDAFRTWAADPPRTMGDRVPRDWVHKAQDRNVLVARPPDRLPSGATIAEVTHDPEHPFFYEHAQDHVPGLYLIEAVRQLGVAAAHLHHDVPRGRPFVLSEMSVRFDRFAEHGRRLFVVCSLRAPVRVGGVLSQAELEAQLVQDERVIGEMKGQGFVAAASAYRALRRGAQ